MVKGWLGCINQYGDVSGIMLGASVPVIMERGRGNEAFGF
jgi:hypothetical protein